MAGRRFALNPRVDSGRLDATSGLPGLPTADHARQYVATEMRINRRTMPKQIYESSESEGLRYKNGSKDQVRKFYRHSSSSDPICPSSSLLLQAALATAGGVAAASAGGNERLHENRGVTRAAGNVDSLNRISCDNHQACLL